MNSNDGDSFTSEQIQQFLCGTAEEELDKKMLASLHADPQGKLAREMKRIEENATFMLELDSLESVAKPKQSYDNAIANEAEPKTEILVKPTPASKSMFARRILRQFATLTTAACVLFTISFSFIQLANLVSGAKKNSNTSLAKDDPRQRITDNPSNGAKANDPSLVKALAEKGFSPASEQGSQISGAIRMEEWLGDAEKKQLAEEDLVVEFATHYPESFLRVVNTLPSDHLQKVVDSIREYIKNSEIPK